MGYGQTVVNQLVMVDLFSRKNNNYIVVITLFTNVMCNVAEKEIMNTFYIFRAWQLYFF